MSRYEAEDSLDALGARARAEASDDVGADEPGALTLYDADQEAGLW
ncbi:hypothetical protein [Streptomyces sp. S-9]|nr:hypothetical protein [Streptomyces sp. S-9]